MGTYAGGRKWVCLLLGLFFLFAASKVQAAEPSLEKNAEGEYVIRTSEDFLKLRTDIKAGCKYAGEKLVIENDLEISIDTEEDAAASWNRFYGEVDGKGHTINYETNSFCRETSLFGFFQGKLCNLNIRVNAILDLAKLAAKKAYGFSVLGEQYGGEGTSLTYVSVSGDITIKTSEQYLENNKSNLIIFGIGETQIVENCYSAINFILDDQAGGLEQWFQSTKIKKIYISQFGSSTHLSNIKNCYASGSYSEGLKIDFSKIEVSKQGIHIAPFMVAERANALVENCYYDKDWEAYSEGTIASKTVEMTPKTTAEMKQQDTYQGFDFKYKWSIAPDKNNGYPYIDLRVTDVKLSVRPRAAGITWNKEGNKAATITGMDFVGLTDKEKALIDQYGVTIMFNPETDVQSAEYSNLEYLGERPVKVTYKNEPSLSVGKAEQAEADGYAFILKHVEDGVGAIADNGASPAMTGQEYYEKAREAIRLILDYCYSQDAFKESVYADTWAVVTGARSGYYPGGDKDYYEKWFRAVKEQCKTISMDTWGINVIQKLALAIEAAGYDPRDVEGQDLLKLLADQEKMAGMYTGECTSIHAYMAAGYEYAAGGYSAADMYEKAVKRAGQVKKATDKEINNADATMTWQYLCYWYDKDKEIRAAVDDYMKRFAVLGQRTSGAFCTTLHEGESGNENNNNAWNDAQALITMCIFGYNPVDPADGFVKNGRTVLDAVFDLINFETGELKFAHYDPSQIARGLNAFCRLYEKEALGKKDATNFWDFSDVQVPTRQVNDAMLAITEKSSEKEVADALAAYDALDSFHKEIFNANTLQKVQAIAKAQADKREEDQQAIQRVIDQINAIGAVTAENYQEKQAAIAEARSNYDRLTAEQKAMVTNYDTLVELEKQAAALAGSVDNPGGGSDDDNQSNDNQGETDAFEDSAPTLKTASAAYNKVKLTWSKVKEADGYKVYRAASKKGKYKSVKTIKKGTTKTCTDTKLTAGKTYYYKVRAYKKVNGKTVYSQYSPIKSAKPVPAAVKIKKATSKKKSVTLKWGKISGANGYAVYRATSKKGKYKKVASVKKPQYVNKKLKKGKTYYYRVRAYRKVSGKNVYGGYSAVKKVKVK